MVSPETVFMVSQTAEGGSRGFPENPESGWREEVYPKASSSQKRFNNGVDSNEQPRKRMRMKKHRPKIYDELKPKKISVPRKSSSKPRKRRPKFTPKPTTPIPAPSHVNKDSNLGIPVKEDTLSSGKISSRRVLDFRAENCIVDHNLEECNGIENVELKNGGTDDIPIVGSFIYVAGCCDHNNQQMESCVTDCGIENKSEEEFKMDMFCDNQKLESCITDSVIKHKSSVESKMDRFHDNHDLENCTMDGGIENKSEVEFKMDRFHDIKVYRRNRKEVKEKSNAQNGIEDRLEVDPKLQCRNRFSGAKVYQRKLRKGNCIMVQHSKECDWIENEPQASSNCPRVRKGKRMRQLKATAFEKLTAFVGKALRAKRQRLMRKPRSLYFGEDDLKKKSQTLRAQKESFSAAEKIQETAEDSTFEKSALNWTLIASLRRKRSRKSIRRNNMPFSFVVNVKRDLIPGRIMPFSAVVKSKRKRSKTFSRRKNFSSLISFVSGGKRPKRKASSSSRTQENKSMLKCKGHTLPNEDYVTEALVDYVTMKMESLSIDEACNQLVVLDQIASKEILATSKENLASTKKKNIPKVDLDSETLRVWNHLMESKNSWNLLMEDVWSKDNEQQEDEREKYWREQREIFRGRVESFIARMHIIQGDRRFTQWKGSVVDSVVGVFLTQNVSDHLSSSAFMNIAANYPPLRVPNKDSGCDDKTQQEKLAELRLACGQLDIVESYLENFPGEEVEDKFEHDVPQSETETSKENVRGKQENKTNWDDLRTKSSHRRSTHRSYDALDSANWEAVRKASVEELSNVIMERGMNTMLAKRIKKFLDRLVRDHGSIDLEWLRDVPPDQAKEYLLSITGLGLKSVECLRLLTLRHHAFPVDTNVARIVVRLGWVPLQPLPGDIQIHLLNDYPPMDAIQKYIWPRLCFLTKLILYELHYQMITFGKLFCTKVRPNCNACPMRGECRHFASAYASSKLKLEGPKDKNMAAESSSAPDHELMEDKNFEFHDDQPGSTHQRNSSNYGPIIELPASPEPRCTETIEQDIEDIGYTSGEEIPTIKMNSEELTNNVRIFLGEEGVSKALTALNPSISSIPMPKLKFVGRLRTVHQVYVLDDSHPLLAGFEKRDADDICPFLLATWTAEELEDSEQDSKQGRNNQSSAPSCSEEIVQFDNDKFVWGTILIPCRTANRGSFPLNGTYFQVNELFADHETSQNPILIPREWLWNLMRGVLYCGTSATTICRGMSMEEVVYTFWKGFICIRGFDQKMRAPRPLSPRFHVCKTRKVAAADANANANADAAADANADAAAAANANAGAGAAANADANAGAAADANADAAAAAAADDV